MQWKCANADHDKYIIDNYDNLPDLVVFRHAHRFQWHNDDPLWGELVRYVVYQTRIQMILRQYDGVHAKDEYV